MVAITRWQIARRRSVQARVRVEDTVRNWLLRTPGIPPVYWRTKRASEARWNTPRPDCPHPDWWTATDEDSTEVEVTELVAAFIRALQPELAVETGTAFGQTAHAIGRALRRNRHGRLVRKPSDAGARDGGATRLPPLPPANARGNRGRVPRHRSATRFALLDELVDEGLMVALVLSTPRGVTFAQPLGLADRGG